MNFDLGFELTDTEIFYNYYSSPGPSNSTIASVRPALFKEWIPMGR